MGGPDDFLEDDELTLQTDCIDDGEEVVPTVASRLEDALFLLPADVRQHSLNTLGCLWYRFSMDASKRGYELDLMSVYSFPGPGVVRLILECGFKKDGVVCSYPDGSRAKTELSVLIDVATGRTTADL